MSDWAVITGATSGLGAAYAQLLASHGVNLILTGRRTEKLESVAGDIVRGTGVEAETVRCELSDAGDRERLLSLVKDRRGVHWLINNAGYGLGRPFVESRLVDHLTMVRVHVDAALSLIHGLVPGMIERGRGAVVNVGSLASLLAVPQATSYVATKAFLLGFSECLGLELYGTGVKVQVLLPGYFRSDFHRNLELPEAERRNRGLIRWMDARDVAESSYRALSRRRPAVIHVPGMANRVAYGLARVLPRRVLYAGARRYGRLSNRAH